jgi:hypothetical protein
VHIDVDLGCLAGMRDICASSIQLRTPSVAIKFCTKERDLLNDDMLYNL